MYNTRNVFNCAIIAGLQYIILTTIAMLIYPGGTFHNHELEHYSFSENFLSDLGRTTLFDGVQNYISAGLYLFTLSFVGVSILFFFIHLPKVLHLKSKIFKLLIIGIGVVAGIGFLGIALAPCNLYLPTHMFFVSLGFRALLVALFLLMIGIYRTKVFPNIYGHVLFASILLLIAYVLLMSFGPNPSLSDEALMVQVVGQKIIVYVLIISVSIQAIGAKKVWNTLQ